MEQELEEFNEIFSQLHVSLQSRVKTMLANYGVGRERFSDIYRQFEFNLGKDRENHQNQSVPLEQDIIQQIEDKLMQEGQAGPRKSGLGNGAGRQSQLNVARSKLANSGVKPVQGLDIFGSLATEKRAVKERQKKKQEEEALKNPAQSKAGKLQQNNTSINSTPASYHQRKSRGQQRVIYNEGVNKIPGLYNPEGKVVAQVTAADHSQQAAYDLLNLNSNARTQALQDQFELIENIMKQQLKMEQFEDFYSPVQTCQRVCGRVINLSTENQKLKEQTIGLFNANYEQSCRLRLNLAEVPQYSLFEGEVIVAEGFCDTKKFNVNRIWKPAVSPVNPPTFTSQELQLHQKSQAGKAVQIMMACGPFTVNHELSYEALKDLMTIVNRDQPHALILSGPFVNQNHEDIESGDLRYRDPDSGELKFFNYEELFTQIMNYIDAQLAHSRGTQVIIVPSTNEISHIYPMPQPPMGSQHFARSKMTTQSRMPVLTSNPSVFMLNDISVGIINTDVVKDMCINMCIKNPAPQAGQAQAKPKIDQVLQSILQQKSFYPLYPAGLSAPIEWEQYKGLMFNQTPDILITPSDLMLFAKNIEGCVCVNPGSLYKGASAGNYAVLTIDPLVQQTNFAEDGTLFSNRASDRIRVDIHNI